MSNDIVLNKPEECEERVSQLQNENQELLLELHRVNEKLRASEQLKGHFISNVSNEIINPFSSIVAISQSIKQLGDSEMSNARHMAGLIFEEAFHLDFQLKNIFAAALIEAGKETIRNSVINLDELIEEAESYFAALQEKNDIQFSVKKMNTSGDFISDREKLDMILKNLISNSLKYSPEHSIVEISFALQSGILEISVSDSGKGIHIEDKELIFDRFKQLDEKINSINTGHGLGLSIVKAYAEMLGGKVSFSDKLSGRTTFVVEIPQESADGKWEDLDDFIFDSESKY
jgi:Signal transduction histidine kinase